MMKNYKKLIVGAVMLIDLSAFGQIPMIRTTFNAAFTPITSGGGGGTLSTAFGDDVTQDNLPIGFNFNYLATTYTSMGVSTNGWASFVGTLASSSQAINLNLFSTTGPNLSIGAWWDDLTTDSIVYKTTGAPGSKIFTIQWNSKSYFSASTQLIKFQVKLFEGTNIIEFHYDNVIPGTGSTSESASIGIEGLTGGNGDFLDAVTGSAFVGNGFLSTTTKWPTRYYRFTPGTPTAMAGGTYNVGSSQAYPTIDEAIADLNHRGILGAVTFALTQSLYDVTPANGDNIFPVFVGPIAGSSPTNSITIQSATGTSTLSYEGAVAGNGANQSSTAAFGTTNEPIIGLVGANNVTIKNLYLTTSASGVVIDRGISMINQSPALGTSFCSVKNVTVALSRTNTSSIGFETRMPTTPTVSAGANSNNTFMDVMVSNVYNGVLLSGNATFPDLNNMFTTSSPTLYNTIGESTPNDIGNGTALSYGLQALNQSSVTINNNIIQNITVNGAVTSDGIFLNAVLGLTKTYNNKIMNIKNNSTTATTGITGIRANIAITAGHELRVYNNFISGLSSAYAGAASATRQIKGIFAQAAGGGVVTSTINIDFNNVSIDGSSSPNISNTCFEIGTTSGPVIRTRNNVFANFTAAQTAPAQHVSWVSTSATLVGNTGSASNYNDLFVLNTTQGNIGFGNATAYATLANWQTAVTQDANSQNCAPGFVNNSIDLHVTSLCLDAAGNSTGISWVTTDIDNAVRGATPDIGADEFTVCSSVNGGTINPTSSSICNGQGIVLNNSGSTIGGGISYAWQTSSSAAGPFTNVTVGTGSNTTAYNTGTLTTGTYFFIQLTSCSVSSLTASSNTVSVLVNSLPSVSVSPITSTICVPGGSSVTLTGSGALTYTWSPIAGLSNTTGVSVNALPAASTVYTLIGANAAGCIATTTTSITIFEAPSLVSISATPSVLCSGSNSTLQVVAALTNSYAVTSISYAPVSTPSTGVTILCNNGAAVVPLTSGTLDDGGWSNQTLPFNFNFFGNSYSSFAVSTNGFIYLGSGSPLTFGSYGTAFPSTTPARPCIGATYSDLDFDGVASGSTIQYFVTGTSPNQKMIVNWTGQFWSNTGTVTAQAILYQSSNIIEVHTFTSTGTNAAVEGIQDGTGTIAYVAPGRNAVTFAVSTPDAYRWSPVGGPISYNWSPATFLSATNIDAPIANSVTASTNYSVVLTALNGCTKTGFQAVNVDTPTINISGSTVICSGGTVNLTASGATTYTWNTSATTASISASPTVNTTFTASGTSSVTGCVGSATQAVIVNANPTVTAVSSLSLICNGQTASLTASGASTYSWNTSATTSVVAISPSVTTSYTVTGTNTNSCSASVVITQSVSACTGLNNTVTSTIGTVVYPNPNTGLFTIELNNGSVKTIEVMDLTGRIVLTNTSSNDKIDFNISNLANGVYYVKVQSNNSVEVIKIVKQ